MGLNLQRRLEVSRIHEKKVTCTCEGLTLYAACQRNTQGLEVHLRTCNFHDAFILIPEGKTTQSSNREP